MNSNNPNKSPLEKKRRDLIDYLYVFTMLGGAIWIGWYLAANNLAPRPIALVATAMVAISIAYRTRTNPPATKAIAPIAEFFVILALLVGAGALVVSFVKQQDDQLAASTTATGLAIICLLVAQIAFLYPRKRRGNHKDGSNFVTDPQNTGKETLRMTKTDDAKPLRPELLARLKAEHSALTIMAFVGAGVGAALLDVGDPRVPVIFAGICAMMVALIIFRGPYTIVAPLSGLVAMLGWMIADERVGVTWVNIGVVAGGGLYLVVCWLVARTISGDELLARLKAEHSALTIMAFVGAGVGAALLDVGDPRVPVIFAGICAVMVALIIFRGPYTIVAPLSGLVAMLGWMIADERVGVTWVNIGFVAGGGLFLFLCWFAARKISDDD